jgi:hypothetical protein
MKCLSPNSLRDKFKNMVASAVACIKKDETKSLNSTVSTELRAMQVSSFERAS